jgi:hypothetical protein
MTLLGVVFCNPKPTSRLRLKKQEMVRVRCPAKIRVCRSSSPPVPQKLSNLNRSSRFYQKPCQGVAGTWGLLGPSQPQFSPTSACIIPRLTKFGTSSLQRPSWCSVKPFLTILFLLRTSLYVVLPRISCIAWPQGITCDHGRRNCALLAIMVDREIGLASSSLPQLPWGGLKLE